MNISIYESKLSFENWTTTSGFLKYSFLFSLGMGRSAFCLRPVWFLALPVGMSVMFLYPCLSPLVVLNKSERVLEISSLNCCTCVVEPDGWEEIPACVAQERESWQSLATIEGGAAGWECGCCISSWEKVSDWASRHLHSFWLARALLAFAWEVCHRYPKSVRQVWSLCFGGRED